MFVSGESGYTQRGDQYARGEYLCLFSGCGVASIDATGPPEARERVHCDEHGRDYPALYACLRIVRLSQLGHFMMGCTRVADSTVTLSGAYGHDGLPGDVDRLTPRARACLLPVPPALALTYWHGGGHNSAGREAPALRAWARENRVALRASLRAARRVVAP